ncbi:hypothetical protein GQ602_005772 [Ophiocordyceps camponoti-floridani]|uniref:Uncharacterized protein n=1 Tax=Ophiocordyceps camponoti-floridani TaxID=2030778 RepID=A0A8H4Q444_9HYPO|nr:hypothetical protein GQ602_005772 [Ophiocordyceps camponoti-floridani]
MKILLALLATLASSATASAPFRHLHFPRNNGTSYGGDGLSPNGPLVTGTSPEPGYGSVPSGGGGGEADETVTATMTSTLHKTRTSYVHGTATSSAAVEAAFKAVMPDVDDAEADTTDPLSTTTVTSKTFTTVTLSRGTGAGAAPDSECPSPATVTVTQPAVTQTVFVTANPHASQPPDSLDDKHTLDSQPYRPHTTVQSVVTVMPYPTGRNGSDPVGAPRPTGYARLRRWT